MDADPQGTTETQSPQARSDRSKNVPAASPLVLGRHTLVELWGCNARANDPAAFREILPRAAAACGATVLNVVVHQFAPQGVTGVAVLAESHLSLHSWPEYNYVGADLFTCGTRLTPEAAVTELERFFAAERVEVRDVPRGEFPAGMPHPVRTPPLPD